MEKIQKMFNKILDLKKTREMNDKITVGSPGSPMVRTPHFYCRGHGFSLWLRRYCQLLSAAKYIHAYTHTHTHTHTCIHIYNICIY